MSKVLSRKGTGKKDFALNDAPIAYQISVVMRNMFATYGAKTVKHVLKELYTIDLTPRMGSDILQEENGGVDAACPGESIPEKYLK